MINDIEFDNAIFTKAVNDSLKRQGLQRTTIINETGYSKQKLYRHLKVDRPEQPNAGDLLKLAAVLNTSLSNLCMGKGIKYLSPEQRDDYYRFSELLGEDHKEAYGIVMRQLLKMPYIAVERLADVLVLADRDEWFNGGSQ